jgi:shikimate dehydrogenase
MHQYGLIGKKLAHSFSKKYFEEKFEKENIIGVSYNLFELNTIEEVEKLFENTNLKGLNVTIPYKQVVIPFLNKLDISAQKTNAVNVIKIENGIKTGYNSDYYGFQKSLSTFYDFKNKKAIVLGTGGASKAVQAVLKDFDILFTLVSREKNENTILYSELNKTHFSDSDLIINTTPLGMYPDIKSFPDIPYQFINENHFVYDLVYNPEETIFLYKAKINGAKTKNGIEMLHLQAEKAWEIWNNN